MPSCTRLAVETGVSEAMIARFFSMLPAIEIRPFASQQDYERMIDYFLAAEPDFLLGMGVDPKKIPDRATWLARLLPDLEKGDPEKQTCYVGWIYDGAMVGHSNVNKLKYGDEAHIHLHIWNATVRRHGHGSTFFKLSANYFLNRFKLRRLLCEPYAENPAPNRVLKKVGFKFIKRYRTVPGLINLEQDVNQYELDHEVV
jgi:RimJ/RimL family protein N-acetyltransferase